MIFMFRGKRYDVNVENILKTEPIVEDLVTECGFSATIGEIELCFWWDYEAEEIEISVLDEGIFILVVLVDFSPEEEKMLTDYFKKAME